MNANSSLNRNTKSPGAGESSRTPPTSQSLLGRVLGTNRELTGHLSVLMFLPRPLSACLDLCRAELTACSNRCLGATNVSECLAACQDDYDSCETCCSESGVPCFEVEEPVALE